MTRKTIRMNLTPKEADYIKAYRNFSDTDRREIDWKMEYLQADSLTRSKMVENRAEELLPGIKRNRRRCKRGARVNEHNKKPCQYWSTNRARQAEQTSNNVL